MDPCQPRSVLQRPYSTGISLVCVGGMLRVEDNSSDALTPAQHDVKSSKSKTTPFKALVSPFTSCAPFTAPTTPCSSLTPLPRHPSPLLTPCASLHADSPVLTPMFTPGSTGFDNQHDGTNPSFLSYSGAESINHLLTPKQVRELRRLCRKTANRAEFEDRLIQVRQVASISAMASPSVHLFDPDNSRSGHELRVWVETNRAHGADWRDERPLSQPAIDELRRWDRQLKAWARSRLQYQPVYESGRCRSSSSCVASQSPDDHDSALQPVRLQFEQLSIETTPVTPLHLSKHHRKLDKGDGGEPHFGLNHMIASNQTAVSSHGPMIRDEVSGCVVDGTDVVGYLGIGSEEKLRKPSSDTSPTTRSRWDQALFSNPSAITVGRGPLAEVVINKKNDIIDITVPTSSRTPQSPRFIRKSMGGLFDTNRMASFEKENFARNGFDNSWGNAILKSTATRGRDTIRRNQIASASFGATRRRNSEEIPSIVRPGVGAKGFGFSSKSELDWSALRGGGV